MTDISGALRMPDEAKMPPPEPDPRTLDAYAFADQMLGLVGKTEVRLTFPEFVILRDGFHAAYLRIAPK